jgi:hypothetical protein
MKIKKYKDYLGIETKWGNNGEFVKHVSNKLKNTENFKDFIRISGKHLPDTDVDINISRATNLLPIIDQRLFVKELIDEFGIVESYTNYINKIAKYIAKEWFYYDDLETLSSGTMGWSYLVDGGKKVLKITTDRGEALRAERLRGKYASNLMTYYDVRELRGVTDDGDERKMWVLLMDTLPIVLTDTYDEEYVFRTFLDLFGSLGAVNNMPGMDIMDKKKLEEYIISGVKEYFPDDTHNVRLIAKKMWWDLIQILRQMKKFGISTNDMTVGNLGFNDKGDLVFYDMGYIGRGEKKIRKKPIEVPIKESNDTQKWGGWGVFNSFLKVIVATGKPSPERCKQCPDNFLMMWNTLSVEKPDLERFLKRFGSLTSFSDKIQNDSIKLYFGVKYNKQLIVEYGILDNVKIKIGEFVLNKSAFNKLKTIKTKALVEFLKDTRGYDINVLKILNKIKGELIDYEPGKYISKTGINIENGILEISFYGLGKWENGEFVDDIEEYKDHFKGWILSRKWNKFVQVLVAPSKNMELVYKIKLK